ncbi:chemotaxis protein CheC [Geomonas sp. Red32]|uniref:chemotaxis protein CheC n=1 Tax=Geomonas sp. Red32 TaxID=2912856 RepID=UPI00202D0076|nr:chemotaxis protein CheC [Geomonas sp. Red32]MCM0083502.1 chemotaxis protein CheC [Geomonas sp. Red32]
MSEAIISEIKLANAAELDLFLSEESQQRIMSADERDTLQEMMNIAFGRAAASLAEVISIFVSLSVPCVQLLKGEKLTVYLEQMVGPGPEISIVEERFYGKMEGSAFLVFPADAGGQLVPLFGDEETLYEGEAREEVERDALLTTGGILIGACVGKLAELLGDQVSYSPAKLVAKTQGKAIPAALCNPDAVAIVLKTDFSFREESVQGFLFLVTSQESIGWLKEALAGFLSQYEG